jgi:uncharacterized protein
MPATYLDSSAIVKLIVAEPESAALRRYLRRRRPLVSSALARTEALRALLLEGERAVRQGRAVLNRLDLVWVSDHILDAAGALLPLSIRPLDAIHLASAQRLGRDLGRIVTYDERMIDVARVLGIKTMSPK